MSRSDVPCLSDAEVDRAIVIVNALVRETYASHVGDYGFLEQHLPQSWVTLLESGEFTIPAFYTRSNRPERITRSSL